MLEPVEDNIWLHLYNKWNLSFSHWYIIILSLILENLDAICYQQVSQIRHKQNLSAPTRGRHGALGHQGYLSVNKFKA